MKRERDDCTKAGGLCCFHFLSSPCVWPLVYMWVCVLCCVCVCVVCVCVWVSVVCVCVYVVCVGVLVCWGVCVCVGGGRCIGLYLCVCVCVLCVCVHGWWGRVVLVVVGGVIRASTKAITPQNAAMALSGDVWVPLC